MRKNPVTTKAPAEQVVKDIRRATRKLHSSEEKIRIVLSGLRGSDAASLWCAGDLSRGPRTLPLQAKVRSPPYAGTRRTRSCPRPLHPTEPIAVAGLDRGALWLCQVGRA